jgi:hypothetical protein
MSNFRGSSEIVIRNPTMPENTPFCQTSEDILKVGFMGLGEEQKANYKVEMQSSTVRIGEEVVLRVTTDNRACEKPLEPVKIKFS